MTKITTRYITFLLLIITIFACSKSDKNATGTNMNKQQTIYAEKQSLNMETLGNARELGGYQTQDGHTVKHGRLLRTAKPSSASEADIHRLTEVYHLAVIADMRMSYERALNPNPTINGVSEVWCPIISEDKVFPNANDNKSTPFERLQKAVKSGYVTDQMYIEFISGMQGKEGYARLFRQLIELPENRSLLFHCTQGKDRTGVAAMLILGTLGVDDETVIQDFLLTNVFNAKLIEQEKSMLSSNGVPEQEMIKYLTVMDQVDPTFMQNVLHYIKTEYGSVTGYVTKELGITEDEISQLKEKFLE